MLCRVSCPVLQETWADQIRAAGFKAVTYENLTGGVVAIHSGFKL
jgi:ubiquinone/menaquinone biosynthesis C-methylase UbiE